MDVADKINKGENVKILHGSTMPSWICRVRTSKLVGGGEGEVSGMHFLKEVI